MRTINDDKLNAFLGRVVGDLGASLSSVLAYIGQKLGLYETLAEAGPLTPVELAERTHTLERYVREWRFSFNNAKRVSQPPICWFRQSCAVH